MTPLVLVVEDEPVIAHVLREVLIEEGYQVEVASDGLSAKERFASTPMPDLLLTDLNLPGLGGMKLIEFLRRDLALAKLPIIVVTGFVIDAADDRNYQAVFQKPFDLSALLDKVKELVHMERH